MSRKNLVDERKFGFRENRKAGNPGRLHSADVAACARNKLMPFADGKLLFFVRNEVVNPAQHRPVLHRDDRVPGYRLAEPDQSLAVDEVKQFHQSEVIHLAARIGDEPPRRLHGLSLVEAELDWFHTLT